MVEMGVRVSAMGDVSLETGEVKSEERFEERKKMAI